MSLQFYFGAAGSGKSWKLNHDLINWSIANPHKRYLIIVPDQFTMHTQMELVKSHPNQAILNIEVLSFGRLAHRVFEEVGKLRLAVLDDTGKSLILRKIAADISDEMPIIGKSLNKTGYIAEVKSTISEFMQYSISPYELNKMINFADNRGALSAKLKDIHRLYEAFQDYIKNKYVTAEETLDILRTSLHKSAIIKGSVIVFDGFTGFTPIQNNVVKELMTLAERVIISVLMGNEENPYNPTHLKEQSLFYLTGKMVTDLSRLARDANIAVKENVYLHQDNKNAKKLNHDLAHLEKTIFRYPITPFPINEDESADSIKITEAPSIAKEVAQTLIKIKELTMEKGFSYREIAIITADMNSYAPYFEREAVKYDIPIYIDQTSGILLNPFTEFIRSALKVIIKNYSYETVFHFLRSGFIDLTFDEIDRLENYVIGCGIKGRKKFREQFVRRMSAWHEDDISDKLKNLNLTREKILISLRPFEQKLKTGGDIIKALYEFIISTQILSKLKLYEESFSRSGDLVRAKEYSQIYRLVMELLDQVYSLLGDEPMSLTEFADIFDAGLLELKIGTIPQNIDRVVIGDIERTRLSRVRVLFFLGINDGNIPVGSSRGGLISDLDREFLKQSAWELSPTPRQKMYIQRLYLYVIMTKPSELLYLSYARINSEGKSLRASYLIEAVLKLFPRLRIEKYDDKMTFAQMFSYADSLDAFILYLRRYVLKSNENNNACYENGITELDILAIIANVLKASEDYPKTLNNLINQAFLSYQHRPLSKKAADLLYGALLNNSVSRLEKFAGCAYAHFLKFGLALSERAKFSFEAVDLGNVYHGVLEIFAAKLAGLNLSLNNFSDEIGERLLREAVECYVAEYGSAVLFGSARDEQMIERIYRIMLRTVRTLNKQLKQGDFLPERYEVAFSQAEGLETVNMALSAEEKMTLRGRIDRIDTCEERNQVLVKVIDYKSGHKQFDLAGLYYGLQLQLVVYLNVALEMTEKAHEGKEVIPAAVLYYHVADPMITDDAELSREEIEAKLLSELKMTGIVNENEEVIKRIDRDFTDKSWVIPVSRKKDGSFTSNSGVLKQEDFAVLTDYVNQKITAMGKQIKSGDIDMAPYENKDGNACTYCDFKQVCGFDIRLPGYRTKKLDPLGRDEALELMRNNTQQNKES